MVCVVRIKKVWMADPEMEKQDLQHRGINQGGPVNA